MSTPIVVEGFPLVRIEVGPTPCPIAVNSLISEIEAILSRNQRFIVLIDARQLTSIPNAKIRRHLGEWLRSARPRFGMHSYATAIVVSSRTTELLIEALSWFAPPPCPQLHTRDYLEAERWCAQRLEEMELRFGVASQPPKRTLP